jgi:dihydroorotase
MDPAATAEAIRARPDVILGVKVRLVSPDIVELGMDLAVAAKAIASEVGVPLMVHVGDIQGDHPVAAQLTPRILGEILTAGDIVTHTLSFHVGALLSDGRLLPEVREARDKGVIFDVGVGKNNFSFDSAKKVLEQDFMPDTISTDLTAMSLYKGPTHSMMECLGKMLSLGLSLEEVVKMTTSRSAEVLGLGEETGSLSVGGVADVSVLEAVEGEWLFRDVTGGTNRGSLALRPVACVRAGEVMPIDYGPHPWGWLPESA